MKNQLIEKKAQWQNHVKQWSTSGKSQAEYCRQHNLSIRLFGYYKRKFLKTKDSGLVELKSKKYRASAFIELVTPDGIMIRFREDIAPANFRNIMMSLRD